MNTVKTFMNENLGAVRVVTNENGEWFVAKDVCDILEISNPTQAMSRLDPDERGSLCLNEGTSPKGGNPNVNVVNEYGLWQLVLGSRKPHAKDFKRWLTHEVIPAIRKNGGYIDGQEHMPAEEKAKLESEVRKLHGMVNSYKYKNEYLREKVACLARIIESDVTGDFAQKKKMNSWSDVELADLDVEGYDDFQSDMEKFIALSTY